MNKLKKTTMVSLLSLGLLVGAGQFGTTSVDAAPTACGGQTETPCDWY
ncbi:hypothetical protein [Cytobacillus sp. IB215665]|nr:hypothetical protein [Cytobacillus sp. IB215665]MDX8367223.1 hypothetical protein [Cytobacillus sp. IB215665]